MLLQPPTAIQAAAIMAGMILRLTVYGPNVAPIRRGVLFAVAWNGVFGSAQA